MNSNTGFPFLIKKFRSVKCMREDGNVPANQGLGEGLDVDIELNISVSLLGLLVGESAAELRTAPHVHLSVVLVAAVLVGDLARVLGSVVSVDPVHHQCVCLSVLADLYVTPVVFQFHTVLAPEHMNTFISTN